MTTETFTASNGATVRKVEERGLVLHHPEWNEYRFYRDHGEALREYFLAERDKELGRWRDPENPDYVVYDAPDDDGDVLVLNERNGITSGYYTRQGVTIQHYSKFDEVAYNYFAAHPVKKPWHDAKPGEVWVVGYAKSLKSRTGFLNRSGVHKVYEANGGQRYFAAIEPDDAIGKLSVEHPLIESARRIWPETEDDDE